jgi:Circularly permutated YpsA SLOG family
VPKVVSGGQTGVDRAALDAARAVGLPIGGWCPRGRLAEDGAIPAEYPLRETPSEDYAERTEWNVRDADATLVLTRGRPSPGTALTIDLARRLERRFLVLDLRDHPDPDAVARFVEDEAIGVLNVAGPRESQSPGIGQEARAFLERAFALLTATRA